MKTALSVILAFALLAPAARAGTVAADPDTAARGAAWNEVLAWDPGTLRSVNRDLASPALDSTMGILSNRVVLVAAPFALVPYVWANRGTQRALETAGAVAASEVASAGLSFGLKALLRRPRPYLVDPELRTPDGPEGSDAMPSGHAAVAFAWATVLAADEPLLAFPALGLASAISFSRIYVGVHYPTDIVAGALLGIGTGVAVIAGREALRQQKILP